MPTYKIKKLTVDDLESFKALGDYMFVSGNELVVHDNELCNDLRQAIETSELVNRLRDENKGLKNQIVDKTNFQGDQGQLREILQEKDNELLKYQDQVKNFEQKLQDINSEIQKLQDENLQLRQKEKDVSKISKQMQELETKVESLTERKKELKRINDSLRHEHKQISTNLKELEKQVKNTISDRDKTRKQIDKFIRLSGYTRLLKEALILRSFIDEPIKRQFQLEKEFKDVMSPPSVRRHLYHLAEVGLLFKPFSGQYHLPEGILRSYDYDDPEEIMKKIVAKIMGGDLGFFVQTLFSESLNEK